MSRQPAAARLPVVLAIGLLLFTPLTHATTKGLNQIVTPDIQPEGVLSLSAQAQHSLIGNSQEVQFELGLTKNLELSLFHGFNPREEIAGAEFNVFQQGPHLLTLGAVNWSSHGGGAQPVFEYGYYGTDDHFIGGAIYSGKRAEGLVGYSHQLTEKLMFSADWQSGFGNSFTLGLTYNFTPDLQTNPAVYFTNSHPHHAIGYIVVTWNISVWK